MWAAHLEGAEAGGDSVHGRRFLRPSGSMESSPAARRRRGCRNLEGDGDRPLDKWTATNGALTHSRDVCAYRAREAAHVRPAHSYWAY